MSDSTSAKPELQRHTQPTHDAASESQRGFWALIATQFQGAFSDNVLRYLLLGIVVGTGISEDSGNRLVSVVMVLFSLPFILFSMSGGYLADRYSKRRVTIGTKFMEIGSMSIATVGLALHSLPIELVGSRWWRHRPHSSARRNMDCCRNFCPRSACPGETA